MILSLVHSKKTKNKNKYFEIRKIIYSLQIEPIVQDKCDEILFKLCLLHSMRREKYFVARDKQGK